MDLNQVTVPSVNLDKAVAFYQELGLKLIVSSMPRYARFECPTGHSTFSIHLNHELPKGNGVHIYFECRDLDERVKRLKERGIQFDSDPEDQPWMWREARLKDPDGNQIVLFFAGTNRIDPPWRLKV